MLVFASDHAGFRLKEKLLSHFEQKGLAVFDAGTASEESCNYAEFGARAAAMVSSDPHNNRAVLVCGSGVGMSIVANKFRGVRAVLAASENLAVMSRRHNDSNVICLGARETPFPQALRFVEKWLETGFEGGRHQQRIDFIAGIENGVGRD